MNKITLIILCVFCSLSTWADEKIIAIDGSGKIEVIPDIIRMELLIYKIENEDIAKAKNYVDHLSSLAANTLIENGVLASDITSDSITIETAIKYDEHENEIPIGVTARRNIDIIIRDIEGYSKIVQSLIEIGVSDISDVKPDVSNYEEVKNKALAEAAKKAKEKATFLAHQFGAKIVGVHKIGNQKVYRKFGTLEEVIVTAQRRGSNNTSSLQYEFQPGTVEVEAKVYVEFIIK